jgi:hypothetical protein
LAAHRHLAPENRAPFDASLKTRAHARACRFSTSCLPGRGVCCSGRAPARLAGCCQGRARGSHGLQVPAARCSMAILRDLRRRMSAWLVRSCSWTVEAQCLGSPAQPHGRRRSWWSATPALALPHGCWTHCKAGWARLSACNMGSVATQSSTVGFLISHIYY